MSDRALIIPPMANPGPNDRDRLLSLEQKVQGWVRDAAENRDRQDQEIIQLKEAIKILLSLDQEAKIDLKLLLKESRQHSVVLSALKNDINATSDLVATVEESIAQQRRNNLKLEAVFRWVGFGVAVLAAIGLLIAWLLSIDVTGRTWISQQLFVVALSGIIAPLILWLLKGKR